MIPRVAFVNGGILGLLSYAAWVRRRFSDVPDVHAEFFVLSEQLSLGERVIRRALCQRLAPDLPGWRNTDRLRYRAELNAGLLARRRLLARGLEHFDVLHFHRQATAYLSLDLMEKVPSIVSIDCTQSCVLQDAASARERRSLAPNVRRDGEIFRRAAAIVSTSQWAAADLRRMYPDCRTPIHVMHNPVRLVLFDRAWMDERRARGDAERVTFLFVGGDFPRKGGPDLLEAWTAGNLASRAELVIVSDWPIPEPLPPGVRVVRGVRGETPAWTNLWRTADVFVMPTRNEAFGLVYQEAAAAGLPSIGTRLNAVPELIDDGRTGVLVTRGDRAELITAMESLAASRERRYQMGIAARHKVEVEAEPEDHRRALVALITQAAEQHGRRTDRH